MAENADHPVKIDLTEFKLHFHLKNKLALSLHFNSPSRRFYLSLIALVVTEMKKRGKVVPIPLEEHLGLLALVNDTVGGSAGSSEKENLLPRIYRKWKHALPNLEEAPLFKVLGKKKDFDGLDGKTYLFTEPEKDLWANLFAYIGSEENVRLKFAIDKIGGNLDDIVITYGDSINEAAWEGFLVGLQSGEEKPAPLQVASIEKMAFPLPDEPSIAVLPFVNLSGDPKQEFLSDGITEEIITALSKVRHLFVISRQSTFSYKGKPVKVKQVSEELGVRYVLEGGVQRSGDSLRITAQLIDALNGHHLWAERYERDLKDLFALQDDITMKILTAIQVKLTAGEEVSGYEKYFQGKKGFDCYFKYMEGIRALRGRVNIDGTRAARRFAEEAMEMCPENPMVYSLMSVVNFYEFYVGPKKSPRETIEEGMEMVQKALAMDDSTPAAHGYLGYFYCLKREHKKAIAEAEWAVALEPGSALSYNNYGLILIYAGRPEEAIPVLQKAIRLNPVGDSINFMNLGMAYRVMGRLEEAVLAYKKALQRSPDNFVAHLSLTATYSMMGREQEAHLEAAEVLRLNPKFSVDPYTKKLPFKDQSINDNLADALRKAGLK